MATIDNTNNTTLTAMLPLFSSSPGTLQLPALPPLQTILGFFLPLIPVHLVLVRLFRRHFVRQLYRKLPYYSAPENASQKPLSELTLAGAHEIIRSISGKDFPYMFNLALQFALIRTYAIPTISHLLVKTAQLSNRTRNVVGKRYADTTVIVTEIYHNEPGSERSSTAFARLNYLHGHYIRQSKISNDDMLYTLSLFMNQPVEWIDKYDYRPLTELEIAGVGLYHRFIGEAMEIDYTCLDAFPPTPIQHSEPSTTRDKRSWRTDGLAFYASLDAWSKAYEIRCMKPDIDCHITASKTIDLVRTAVPEFMFQYVSHALVSLMDDRMRLACQLPLPPNFYRIILDSGLCFRAWIVRHFCLPRRSLWGWWVSEHERGPNTEYTSKDGRRWLIKYDAMPHYVKPTLWNRWGPGAWMSWALGAPVPGDKGMLAEGWTMGEVGPDVFKGKGVKEAEITKAKLIGNIHIHRPVTGAGEGSGCPFFVKV